MRLACPVRGTSHTRLRITLSGTDLTDSQGIQHPYIMKTFSVLKDTTFKKVNIYRTASVNAEHTLIQLASYHASIKVIEKQNIQTKSLARPGTRQPTVKIKKSISTRFRVSHGIVTVRGLHFLTVLLAPRRSNAPKQSTRVDAVLTTHASQYADTNTTLVTGQEILRLIKIKNGQIRG